MKICSECTGKNGHHRLGCIKFKLTSSNSQPYRFIRWSRDGFMQADLDHPRRVAEELRAMMMPGECRAIRNVAAMMNKDAKEAGVKK